VFGFIKTKAAAWAEKETKEGRAINVENRGCDICDEDFDTYPDGPEPGARTCELCAAKAYYDEVWEEEEETE
jgi:hypothetical protein